MKRNGKKEQVDRLTMTSSNTVVDGVGSTGSKQLEEYTKYSESCKYGVYQKHDMYGTKNGVELILGR